MNFYERYIEMCNKIGKAPSTVAIEIGLSKPSVNRWKNGGHPTDATAAKIAAYFNVSVAYLYGEEEGNEEIKKQSTDNDELSIEKKKLIDKVMQMSDEELQKLDLLLRIVESK